MELCFRWSTNTHCPIGLCAVEAWTNLSFIQLDCLLTRGIHSPVENELDWTYSWTAEPVDTSVKTVICGICQD